MTTEIEIRCPNSPGKLLAKLRMSGERPHITDDNLVEFACDDCKRNLRKRGKQVFRVLHRYNLIGDLVETVVE